MRTRHTRDVTWLGEALIEPGKLVFRGQLGSAHAHGHAALQIVTIDDGAAFLVDADGRGLSAPAAIIPAGAEHSIEAQACQGMMLYLEPTSVIGSAVTALFRNTNRNDVREWVRLGKRLVNVDVVKQRHLSFAANEVIAYLVGAEGQPRCAVHPGVEAAVDLLPGIIEGPVKLSDVARTVHLSADRLGRLFAHEVGMSFTAYVRWCRLIRAMEVVRDGGTITDAAHAAGFSDSAHANRVFHEMFGLAPIDARRGVRLT